MKRIRFQVSDAFLQQFEKILGESSSRGKLVRLLLQHWDGCIRPIPGEWRGTHDLRVTADERLEQIIESVKLKGVADRHEFLYQAFAHFVAEPSMVEEGGSGAKNTRKKTQGHRATKKKDAGATAKTEAAPPSLRPAEKKDPGRTAKPSVIPDTSSQDAAVDAGDLPPKRMAILKRNLLAMQKDCMDRIFELSHGERESHEKSMDGDDADLAALNIERTERQNEIFRLQKQLREIDHALNKMKNGVYGHCEETGEPISFERLLANPTARLSLEAQQHKEKSLRMAV